MNGEVNGLVEAMDTSSPPKTPPPTADTKQHSNDPESTVTGNHCDENNSNITQTINNSENSNHMDSDHSNDTAANTNSRFSDHENDKNDHSDNAVNESSNDVTTNNHCDNSNESTAGSTISSQQKHVLESGLNQAQSHQIEENDSGANDEDSSEEDDSEEDSSDDEGSVGSEGPRAEDTVSVNSDSDLDAMDDDSTRESQLKTKNKMTLDNVGRIDSLNGDNRGSQSPEVHEIDSDNEDGDCIVTSDDKAEPIQAKPKEESHHHSSRAVKLNSYHDSVENGDKESDIEEISTEDPLNSTRKNKPIIVNDTKALVEMASKQIKEGKAGNEPTVVIIDTNSSMPSKGPVGIQQSKSNVSPLVAAQNLYQSIAARGTTVTPVSSKQSSSTQVQTTPPIILPSLTDDMYVVEAPSFIVPYVYEKPSVKPFREFVDILGRDLDLEREKEEAKEREEKEIRARERKERGEEPEDSDKESDKEPAQLTPEEVQEEPGKKKKSDKKNRKRGHNDDDDASWDGETTSESEDEAISDDDTGTTVVIKEKDDDALEKIKNNITSNNLTESTKLPGIKTDNYFDNALGKFFINIGVNLVQEYVQADLLKQQKRKLHKETKTGSTNTKATESTIASLSKNLLYSKENNAPYAFPQKRCKYCSFKTESMLAMSHHLETPHMKNNVYNCNFCPFEIRSPHDILYHMEEQHNTRGRLERAPAYHQCANCPFEDNGKGKLARHLIPCAKKFKPEQNLAPPVEWEPPAKIPKVARARNNMGGYQTAFNRIPVAPGIPRAPLNMSGMLPGVGGGFRARGRSPMGAQPRGAPIQGSPFVRGGVMMRHNAPLLMPNNYPLMNAQGSKGSSPKLHQPSISITPLPRAPQPAQQPSAPHTKGTFVICEICDGYIKDLEQLRNHMQWIHKVKIHPKMIYNRPPLNCQKCQFRFFTDQGLERHLLGSHGLVTSSMQEAANKGKDAGRCPVCGRVYQWKLLNHVARDHNLTLKPAHLSYKCTVCTATFSMYKQFENHVYSAHSVVAKKVMDKGKTAATSTAKSVGNDNLLKPLKINDEITIIPQPSKVPTKGKKD